MPANARRAISTCARLATQAPALAPELVPRVHVGAASAGVESADGDGFGAIGFWDALAGRAAAAPAPARLELRRERASVMDRVLTLAALYVIARHAGPKQPRRFDAR